MHAAAFIQQQRAVARHAHQHVAGALLLQKAGAFHDLGVGVKGAAEDLAQFVVVGLDEERLVGQHLHQQFAGGVHRTGHALRGQFFQNALVNVAGQAGGNAARQHQHVPGGEVLQLVEQLLQRLRGDVGALAVDLGLGGGLDLHVDTGQALAQADKIGVHPPAGQPRLHGLAGETGHKAQGYAFEAQLAQHTGDVDPLAAQLDVLALGAVHAARLKGGQAHHIVQRGVEGHGVDHWSGSTSLMMACFA